MHVHFAHCEIFEEKHLYLNKRGYNVCLILYPIEVPIANTANLDQTSLVRTTLSGSTLFAFRNMSMILHFYV